MLRFLDAGESHGKALTAIIEGIPSNIDIDIDFINNELKRRQTGYGRGIRMAIEKDKVEIWSGIRENKTTGNPITLIIYNKDYENWKELINKKAEDKDKIFVPRPGHGDLVGHIKYNTGDIRNVIERTSARETAIRTAVGAMCKYILKLLGIDIRSKIQSIGEIFDENVDIYDNDVYREIEDSLLRCYNKKAEKNMMDEIDNCKKEGDTIGGSIYISVKGMPVGIGSYTQWDRKLDALLSYSIMSVQGIKAIEFGEGLDLNKRGSTFNDEIYYDENNIKRKSNNAGGIEAGVSNGEDIIIKAYMKPIPSIKKPIKTINLKEKINVENRYERSDVCGVVPASIVLENVCAFEILKEILSTYPCDDFNTLKKYIREM
ncbi:chorismate synthase [Clostridium sporogenes]|uniref:Chorismate synthase n=2 Tax=Clostridium TaxID=1485 RepID=A0A0D1ANR4_CLOBO|nr:MULTISPECIES: chorismate synthase [Clostridium]MBE6078701.1 chorismate synthase [Clostridium lundense]MDU2832706.1 chorismate synthase [Clostridium botulinum]KIS24799.1 chorismate synthase [Clostridium botulinum B2 450]MCW6092993.1 chorismate synthase [Clostridium sporogenes]MCW7996593.1 chorismate synthase [Clostridium sp. cpc1]